MEDKKSKIGRNKHKVSSIFIIGNTVLMVAVTIFSFVYFNNKLKETQKDAYEVYQKHYAFISNNREQDFWNEVYKGALKEGKEQSVYVERFGNKLFSDYSKDELMRMAIDAAVDGIILEGDGDNKTRELVNEAVDKGIPVITVLKDSTNSIRQCFVGINSYNLGQEYGKQVLKLRNQNTKRVYVLVDENSTDSSQNIILLGIRETIEKTLGKNHGMEIKAVVVNNEDEFSPEETIRDIIMDAENIPDIMICLNSTYTMCSYQAVVDHNMVGKINIIGYYDSDSILSAIQKGIIYSSISVDTEQMGSLCVEALEEYTLTGHVSEYLPVDTKLITSLNVSEYYNSNTESE
ncbi:substrate-binding domain-containing protein [Anaerocolumna sp. MB42-C2]|uniref:substrate-binding domain-containing protein n=1 Tax=Anaerocolumna sp. MB42-C2 TaxID=3070997 RepID=UPI0027E15B41|nr:substrate-binding domain-containing protein [Anaerocolumna sp. MB42-C2]WMJ87210.1 substrate-binding domain-containing protein [Anaerocolumna sp. MB42-C2]